MACGYISGGTPPSLSVGREYQYRYSRPGPEPAQSMRETAAGLADHPLRTSSLISASNFTWLTPIRSCAPLRIPRCIKPMRPGITRSACFSLSLLRKPQDEAFVGLEHEVLRVDDALLTSPFSGASRTAVVARHRLEARLDSDGCPDRHPDGKESQHAIPASSCPDSGRGFVSPRRRRLSTPSQPTRASPASWRSKPRTGC